MSTLPNFNDLNVNAFDDIAWEGAGAGTSTGANRHDRDIYRLKASKPVQIRFMTDPGRMDFEDTTCMRSTLDGSWVKYREIQAWEDVTSGANPSGRVTHAYIPVTDYEITQSGGRKDRKDPVQRTLRASDRELSDERWGKSYPKAKDMMLVSVIYEGGSFNKDAKYDPDPGTVLLLALSPLQAKALGEEMQTVTKYVSDFSFTTGVWTLVWYNPTPKNPSSWALGLTQDREVPPLSVVPHPMDARAALGAIRSATEQELFGLDEVLAAVEADADDEAVAAFEEVAAIEDALVEEDVPEWDRPENKTHLLPKVTAPVDADVDNPFKRRSPAWVKGMLKKHKVDFDPRTPNDQLYELAYVNLPVEIAA